MIKKIEGLKTYYVDNEGNIYREENDKISKVDVFYSSSEHKYWSYSFWEDGESHTESIHRVVAKAFPEICGEWFEGCVVDHKDGNGLNNKASNLKICSQADNTHNPITLERLRKAMTNNPNNHFKGKKGIENYNHSEVNQYDLNGNFVAHYDCITDAYNKTGINNISAVCRGIRQKAGGYIWRYTA